MAIVALHNSRLHIYCTCCLKATWSWRISFKQCMCFFVFGRGAVKRLFKCGIRHHWLLLKFTACSPQENLGHDWATWLGLQHGPPSFPLFSCLLRARMTYAVSLRVWINLLRKRSTGAALLSLARWQLVTERVRFIDMKFHEIPIS